MKTIYKFTKKEVEEALRREFVLGEGSEIVIEDKPKDEVSNWSRVQPNIFKDYHCKNCKKPFTSNYLTDICETCRNPRLTIEDTYVHN